MIPVKVVHSQTKTAWNLIGTTIGGKYKIACFPYNVPNNEDLAARERKEAFDHATFTADAFNKAVINR